MRYILKNNHEFNDIDILLESRGIDDIEEYLNPCEKDLLDPLNLDNIEEAAELLIKFLNKNAKICFIVDCDQDGYTSSAILWQYIKRIYPESNLIYKIHSGKQHGLEDMQELLNSDIDLLLVPDASSNDFDFHREFKEANIPIIVLDHHEAEKISENAIIVNNQLSKEYTNKFLSGAGIVYKFCKLLDKYFDIDIADEYLDLVAIGIVGDMMSVVPLENRYIIKKGLSNIVNPCIKALIEKQSFSIKDTDNLTPTDISFYITPLINALIRVGKDEEKEILFESLIDGNRMVQSTKRGDKDNVESLSEQNARNCVNARARQNRSKDKAIEILDMRIQKEELYDNKIIIVEVEDEDKINPNLTGLIAMQLTAKYKKPCLVVKENSDGFLRGSARGDSSSELKDLKTFFQQSGYFEYAEGHPQAHGVSIEKNKLERFINFSNEALKDINFNEGVYEVDFIKESSSNDLIDLIIKVGKYSDLWGKDNDEPLFAITNIKLNSNDIEIIGKNKDTFKFSCNGITYIKFKAAELIDSIQKMNEMNFTIIGRANLNEWGGYVTPQIIITDYEVRDTTYDF